MRASKRGRARRTPHGGMDIEDQFLKPNLGSLKSVTNIASISAVDGGVSREYAASKGALLNYTRNLANTYARFGIRANVVLPGAIDTPLNAAFCADIALKSRISDATLLGRWGMAEEVARAIYFLAVEATYTTGQFLMVDGGELCKSLYVVEDGDLGA